MPGKRHWNWHRNLPLLVLLAIGSADGQAGGSLPQSTQSPIAHGGSSGGSLPRSTQSPASGDMVRAIPSPDAASRDRKGTTPAILLSRPDVSDFYPPAAVQRGEQGKVNIEMCYGRDGVVNESRVKDSSGNSRLDEAASRMGSKYRFKPATENGAPIADCVRQTIIFSLRQ